MGDKLEEKDKYSEVLDYCELQEQLLYVTGKTREESNNFKYNNIWTKHLPFTWLSIQPSSEQLNFEHVSNALM